jgi:hypothetical protein
MKIGDEVKVQDGRVGTLIAFENGVATVLFHLLNFAHKEAFTSGVKIVAKEEEE